MIYTHSEEIKEYLKNKGYASFVIEKGLNYLIPTWEKSINTFCDADLIYEYRNDHLPARLGPHGPGRVCGTRC